MNLMNLAKEGLEAYQRSHSDVSKTGGEELNRPDNRPHSGSGGPDLDEDFAVKKASEQGSGDSSLFATAMGFLKSNSDEHKKPVDEDEVTRAHEKVYNQGSTSGLSSQLLGGAAAMQAFKMFTGGEKKEEKTSGGNTQSQLISLAMAEASKLFDKSGGSTSGNKQDAVNGAAMTVMKLLLQSKLSGTTGGKDSGGLSGLMSLASKFA